MRLLAVETSGALGAVGAADGERVLAERALPAARRHARDLVPLAAETLAELGWRPAELAGVLVCVGPGSFTGLRVGLAFAKTLAAATGAKLVAVDALAASAWNAAGAAEPVVHAAADALRQRVFAGTFAVAEGVPTALAEPRIMPAEEWLATLRPGELVAGPAALALASRLPAGVRPAPLGRHGPSLAAVHRLGVLAFRAGAFADPDTLEPAYFSASSAEEKRAALTEASR